MDSARLKRIAAGVLSAGLLVAQQPAPTAPQQQMPPLILKSTTRLVMLNVVARDKNGQPAMDLKKDDFRVRVNGKVQPITVFSLESANPIPDAATAPQPVFGPPRAKNGALLPSVFSNRLGAQNGSPSGVNIILLDTRNTNAPDQIFAKAEIIRYLRTLQPTDHIGLYTFGASLKVIHDYTSDSAGLLEKLKAAKNWTLPDTAEPDSQGAIQSDSVIFDTFNRGAGGTSPAERQFYTTDRVMATLHAFDFIAEHLAQLPGRKNLIWISGGIPFDIGFNSVADLLNPAVDQISFHDEVDRTLRAMNDASISVYPVDARGLIPDMRFSAQNRTIPTRATPTPDFGAAEQSAMQDMADRTGGLAFYNTNNLSHAIHAAVDDSLVTYAIGFYPSDDSFDGKFHKIDVDTPERSGIKLRYRKGYFDLAEKPQDDQSRKEELHDAVWSPIDASAMGIVATVRPAANNPAAIDIALKIDHSTIGLQQESGRWQGRLDFLFVQRDDQGKEYGGLDDTVSLNLTQDTFTKLQADDLAYHRVIARSAPAKLLRIVVRDAASGAMGSVTVPLAKVR